MPKAFCMIREQPHYRRDAFVSGLRAVGYDVRMGGPRDAQPGDVLVGWNRYTETHEIASRFEKAGGIYVCAENGYLGPGGISPHEMGPREWYALAIGGHNGSGTWAVGGPERWQALHVDLKLWRADGEHILVCPNRAFGRPDLIMPLGWDRKVVERLQRVTKRPIRVRPHPGNGAHKTPLKADLDGAWACVIWSSSAGVQALIRGIPVICESPAWICRLAARLHGSGDVDTQESTQNVRRRAALHRLAWAQWHVSEISSGDAFRHLLKSDPQLSRTFTAETGGSQAATPHLARAVARIGEA